jgi:hypothetical protein
MSILLAVLLLLFALPCAAADTAVVAGVRGAPTVVRDGATTPLQRGDAVATGDRIATDASSRVKLLLADDSVLSIGSGTEVVIDELLLGSERRGRLRVLAGRFKLAIAAWLSGPSDYQIETPTAVAGVRGTVLWGDTALDAICALQGTVAVRVRQGSADATLGAGQCVTGMGDGKTTPLAPSREDLARYLAEVSVD